MDDPNDEVTPLHVELPATKYAELKRNAKAGHRSLKGEVLRLMELVYGNDNDAAASQNDQNTTAEQAVAV